MIEHGQNCYSGLHIQHITPNLKFCKIAQFNFVCVSGFLVKVKSERIERELKTYRSSTPLLLSLKKPGDIPFYELQLSFMNFSIFEKDLSMANELFPKII